MQFKKLVSFVRRFKFYFLISAFSVLPLLSIFLTTKLLHTHDGLVHLARIAAYFKALSDFQFPVRWAGDLNYGYGMPLFNFMYQLPYFLSSIFLYLGFGLVNSFKIVLSLSFILSGIFILLFANAFFKDPKKGFLVAIFYQFAPFRLIEVLTRGSFGEVYTYTFFPLVLFGLTKLFQTHRYKYFFLTAAAVFLLVISHNALSLVFFAISVCFILFFAQKKNYVLGFGALFSGLLLSSFYWIPAIFEHKFTYGDLFMKNLYLSYFPQFQNFFIPNPTNLEVLQTKGISVQLGVFHVIFIFLAILTLFKSKKIDEKTKKVFIFSLMIFLIALFFMQPVSLFFWERISWLRQFQFPWRFLAVEAFVTSLLSVSFFSIGFLKNKWVYLATIILVVFSTAYYWKPALGYKDINEKDSWNYPLNTTYFGETDVIWSEGPAKAYPKSRVDVIGGKAEVKNFTKKTQIQTFIVDAKTDAQLVDHTQYFPGWKVYANGKEVPIEFQDQNWRGQITFYLPKGLNNVKVVFTEDKIRFFADVLSLSSFVLLLGLFPFRKKFYA